MARDLRDLKELLNPEPPWWMTTKRTSDDWMLWSLGQ